MAEGLVFNMAEKLIGRLGSIALESWNVKSEIEKLKNTMLTIKAVLLDAEEKQDTDHQVKDWLDKLKDAIDDADILLDDFSTEALRQQVMTRGYKKAKKVRYPLLFSFKMAPRIKEIRKELEAIDDDRKKFHFTNRTLKQRVEIKRETHSLILEKDVVGREEEKKQLLEFLMDSDMDIEKNVSIISIIGFEGLGKTALAQLVYNDGEVNMNFDMKMWVYVSNDFDVKAIAMKILEAANHFIRSETNDEINRVRVEQELRKTIEGKRYLLVLDDIWNENVELWLQLMTLLKDGIKGSKIIITTRIERVAMITGTSLCINLKGLDDKQSWKLFTQLAFENGTEPENQNLIAIGKEIVRKCAGVPLAIRTIGSLMYSKKSEKDWSIIKDKDLVKIDGQTHSLILDKDVVGRAIIKDKDLVKIDGQTHSLILEKDVVGREEQKKQLLEFLMDSDMDIEKNVSIISIIGFGGLGKTALAQLVYNDKAVQGHFELKMWVCVSDDFDVKAIAMKIIESKTNDGMEQVQQELRKKIEGRRYLLVLDDIWNENDRLWGELMTLLNNGGQGSKIIITTRSKVVAKISRPSLSISLKGLDDEQSWNLFTQFAFENGTEPENQNLTAIGREIVKKCAGVPLAIRTIGSLMYSKKSEKDWSIIKDKDLVEIDEQGDKRVLRILKLSYDHLPVYLKKCFSFCSLFPKDYEISRLQLIKLWVAQGFVQSLNDSICLEDVGNEYFMNLAHRSFFQDLQRDHIAGDILWCKMNNLVHDFAKDVAGHDCIVNEKGKPKIDERTRHLSFGFPLDSSWQAPSSFLKAIKLRTFLLPQQDIEMDFDCNSIISSFEQLHVLDLNHLSSRTLPTCIDMLKHLRYLDLSLSSQIEVLPESITKLYNLQTLILNDCFMLRELPRDLWKLTRLRHLELDGCFGLTCMPRGIGQLTNLQTLSLFVLHSSSKHSGRARELGGLNNLRGSLEIKGLECLRCNTTEVKDINLMEKSNIDTLTLTWYMVHDGNDSEVAKDNIILEGLHPHDDIKSLTIIGFGGAMISSWVYSLTNLLGISIDGCTRLRNLSPLHRLLHLKRLTLRNLPCLEWIDKDDSDDSSSPPFLPSLEHLNLWRLPNLQGWWRCSEEGIRGGRCHQLKSLDKLYVVNCPKLSFMPLPPSVSRVMLNKVSEKILQQAINHSTTLKLEYLHIKEINDLKSLSGVQHLTALRQLYISNCEELDPCNDQDGAYGMQWKQLQNLRELWFSNIPKMESLPDGLQHVTTLRKLEIDYCANLTNLPEWIASLGQSLQVLRINNCTKLMSLPEGMRRLTSLQTLRIIRCPHLEERCRKEVGEDLPKISHVPKFKTSWV